jgi:hypothetical protein
MANVIQVKRNIYTGTGNPSASNVAYGELAWNNGNGGVNAGELWIGQQTGTNPVVIAPRRINKTVAGTTNEIAVVEAAEAFTISLPDDVTIGKDLVVTGDLTVSGDTITANVATITIEDKTIELGKVANTTDALVSGSGIITTGTSSDVKSILYSSGDDKWVSNKRFDAPTFFGDLTGDVTGDVTGALTGNADSASTAAALTGDQASEITANTLKTSDINHNVTTNLSVSADGDGIKVVSSDGTDAVLTAASTSAWGVMTDAMFDEHEVNNGKTSDINHNANHSGDVSGATTLTIGNGKVTRTHMANMATSRVLGRITATAGGVEELTGANLLTIIGTIDGGSF